MKRFAIFFCALAGLVMCGLTGCESTDVGDVDGEGEGRAAVRYDQDEVKQMFLAAYQKGDRAAGRKVASAEAVAKLRWDGDPKASLDGDSILSGDGGTEIEMIIYSDGHVGANIADVVVRR